MAEQHPIDTVSTSTPPTSGKSVERGQSGAPELNLVDWHDQAKQRQIDRMAEMLDDLREEVVAGRVSTLALVGISDGEAFCQWEGQQPNILYSLELAKAELMYEIRFGEDSDSDRE